MRTKFEKRLFIGIPADREIQPILTDIQSSIEQNSKQIRWISLKNIHITLFFLGNVSLNDLPQLIQTLEDSLVLNQFRISIEKTGVFPSNQHPNILWLGVGIGRQKIITLHELIEETTTSFIAYRKRAVFIPHITIGKLTRSYGKIDFLPFLKYVYSPTELNVNFVALYESQLMPKGVEYKLLTKFPLN